jgi:lipid-binding SYLF domain-containing protein
MMNFRLRATAGLTLLLLVGPATAAMAQMREASTVEAASNVLREIMEIPARSIPVSLLNNAQGVVIIPGMIKGGFVIGVRHGSGVVLTRDEAGHWAPPSFCTMTGASIGWQIGLQGTDVILVLVTKNSVQGLMRSKVTIGVDLAASAGPVGREAAVATDASLKAEIYSYSRSRGLFAGASLDGTALRVDSLATNVYYRSVNPNGLGPGQPVGLPPEAARLLAQLAQYTAPSTPGAVIPTPATAGPVPVVRPPANDNALRQQLIDSARQLSTILDENWKVYLALPPDVYANDRPPSADGLRVALGRFDSVAGSAAYGALNTRPEFQATRDLLRRYLATLPPTSLTLPSPPR